MAERDGGHLARLLGVGDVERHHVRLGHGLQPVVAGEHGHAAVLPLELRRRFARGLVPHVPQQVEAAVERVDVDALAMPGSRRGSPENWCSFPRGPGGSAMAFRGASGRRAAPPTRRWPSGCWRPCRSWWKVVGRSTAAIGYGCAASALSAMAGLLALVLRMTRAAPLHCHHTPAAASTPSSAPRRAALVRARHGVRRGHGQRPAAPRL